MLSTAYQQAFQQYRAVQAQTASPGHLVVMLYQGAITFSNRARAALLAGDHPSAHENLLRAQDIIAELLGTLDLEQGEIAERLACVYEYIHRRLVQANVRKSVEPLDEVLSYLRDLRDAWQEAIALAAQTRGSPATPDGACEPAALLRW
jgi:flagellar protein FliS